MLCFCCCFCCCWWCCRCCWFRRSSSCCWRGLCWGWRGPLVGSPLGDTGLPSSALRPTSPKAAAVVGDNGCCCCCCPCPRNTAVTIVGCGLGKGAATVVAGEVSSFLRLCSAGEDAVVGCGVRWVGVSSAGVWLFVVVFVVLNTAPPSCCGPTQDVTGSPWFNIAAPAPRGAPPPPPRAVGVSTPEGLRLGKKTGTNPSRSSSSQLSTLSPPLPPVPNGGGGPSAVCALVTNGRGCGGGGTPPGRAVGGGKGGLELSGE